MENVPAFGQTSDSLIYVFCSVRSVNHQNQDEQIANVLKNKNNNILGQDIDGMFKKKKDACSYKDDSKM